MTRASRVAWSLFGVTVMVLAAQTYFVLSSHTPLRSTEQNLNSFPIITLGTGTAGLRLQSIGGGGGLLFVDVTSEDPSEFGGVYSNFGATDTDNSSGGAIDHHQTGFIGTTGNFSAFSS